MLHRATPVFPEYSRAMRIVQEEHSIFRQGFQQLREWGKRAVMPKDSVGEQNEPDNRATAHDGLCGVRGIAVFVLEDRTVKKSGRIFQARMGMFINKDMRKRTGQRLSDHQIRRIT